MCNLIQAFERVYQSGVTMTRGKGSSLSFICLPQEYVGRINRKHHRLQFSLTIDDIVAQDWKPHTSRYDKVDITKKTVIDMTNINAEDL